ncbi:cytochrome b [Methylophaga muralis]|uniref:Cytochrome b561 bacterial/Ni-hydrogenase domain-containing protein n=1 Tax=Methylophaga muralis TaxID=291169 RepID=A0A1E3GU60_9GAMM|nr:cytochrome b [Methylophaga muralis]ODN67599.1 hypothetical protein A9E74_00707 [Methylophaga muralis]
MRFKNSSERYGLISIVLHWSVALLTIGLFVLGLWMVDLGYYDDWYYQAPWWHKGLGFIVLLLVLIRWLWRPFAGKPAAISTTPVWQNLAAKTVHQLMNLAIIVLAVTGYLIVTAKGQPLGIFDWFNIPALTQLTVSTSDLVSKLHLWSAYFIIALASIHALAALKHHFINKDATLRRMLNL